MDFRKDEIYPIYVAYLERKKMSPGALQLSKISNQMFSDFRKRYVDSPGFRDQQDNLFKNVSRDIKLGVILDSDSELDRFLDEL